MPDPFVEDLDRGNDKSPSASTREYVRWQRGPLTRTPMSLMYMRERTHGTVRSYVSDDVISAVLRDDLKDARYDLPLTLETQVPPDWKAVDVRQGKRAQRVPVVRDDGRSYVLYPAIPNGEDVRLARAAAPSR